MQHHFDNEFCQTIYTSGFKLERVKMLTCPKLQTKISNRSTAFSQGEIHQLSNDEQPTDIGHEMRMVLDTRKSNFGTKQWLQFHIWLIYGKMQIYYKSDRFYYKMQQLFYYKIRQKFITIYVNCFITKCDSFIKNPREVIKCGNFITKCNSYYRMRRLMQACWYRIYVIIDNSKLYAIF